GKYAICGCPERLWFFYINSEKPFGRKSAAIAIRLTSYDLHFLTKSESFLDVSILIPLDASCVAEALVEAKNRLGPVSPTLRAQIVAATRSSNVLEPRHREAVY